MYAHERHAAISATIATAGRASVSELAAQLGVTTETIRRDLDALEEVGLVQRVHGGAVAPDRVSAIERPVAQRTDVASDAKRCIAAAALRFVPTTGGAAIALDAGTTVGALASALSEWKGAGRLPVITHSVTAAATLVSQGHIDLHLLGGRVRPLTGAAVGSTTTGQLARLRPDVAFLGTNAISATSGLTTPDEDEAGVKSALIAAARRIVLLVDATKFDEESLVVFADLARVDAIVTDARPTGDLAAALEAAEVEVVIA